MKTNNQLKKNNEFLKIGKIDYYVEYKNVFRLGKCLCLLLFILTGAILLYFGCFYSLLFSDDYWQENQDKYLYITLGLLISDFLMLIQHILTLISIINHYTNLLMICIISSIVSVFIRICMFYLILTKTKLNYYSFSQMATIQTCIQCSIIILVVELKNLWLPIPEKKWQKIFRFQKKIKSVPNLEQIEMSSI